MFTTEFQALRCSDWTSQPRASIFRMMRLYRPLPAVARIVLIRYFPIIFPSLWLVTVRLPLSQWGILVAAITTPGSGGIVTNSSLPASKWSIATEDTSLISRFTATNSSMALPPNDTRWHAAGLSKLVAALLPGSWGHTV